MQFFGDDAIKSLLETLALCEEMWAPAFLFQMSWQFWQLLAYWRASCMPEASASTELSLGD